MVAAAGLKADRPSAIVSALTNSVMPSASRSSAGPTVDLPDPLGPARTITSGEAGWRDGAVIFRASRQFLLPTLRVSRQNAVYAGTGQRPTGPGRMESGRVAAESRQMSVDLT